MLLTRDSDVKRDVKQQGGAVVSSSQPRDIYLPRKQPFVSHQHVMRVQGSLLAKE